MTATSNSFHFIPVATPQLGDLESRYMNEALQSGFISGSTGDFLERFEGDFAKYIGCRYAVAVSSGTTALHLALATLGVGLGDEVVASTFTNMATFFAIIYQGAHAIPADIEEDTWNLNPALLESRITPRTKAILPVHIYGHSVDMDPVLGIAKRHGLYVVEDAAEAHGATYKGRKAGSLSDIGCFSFYANKILTTGEGGMITTDDERLATKARSLRGLAFGATNRFMHKEIGFNYRLTNLQAALGCAQLEKIENVIERKRRIAHQYHERLACCPELQLPVEKSYARNVYWMYHVVLRHEFAQRRRAIMQRLLEEGIETREGFIPYNLQEIFIARGWTSPDECPIANRIAAAGFYLPSSPNLTEEHIDYITDHVKSALRDLV